MGRYALILLSINLEECNALIRIIRFDKPYGFSASDYVLYLLHDLNFIQNHYIMFASDIGMSVASIRYFDF